MLKRSVLRQIRGSIGRYLAILAIIALGVGLFTGLNVTKDTMLRTGDAYLSEMNFFDFRLISTLGLTEADVAAFSELDGVAHAVGSVSLDVLYLTSKDAAAAIHAHSLHDAVNTLDVIEGRLPQRADECVVDALGFSSGSIGTELVLSSENEEDTLESFACDSYTIVGRVNSPGYINFDRGSTSLANGQVTGFVYLLPEGFSADYFTEIYLTIPPAGEIYSDEYEAAIDAIEPSVTELLERRAHLRYEELYSEAAEEIDDAQAELDDGWATYRTERADAEAEIEDARQTLADARAELDDGWEAYRTERADAEAQIADARAQLVDARAELDYGWHSMRTGRTELEEQRADAEAQFEAAQAELDTADAQLSQGEAQLAELDALYSAGLGLMQGLNTLAGTAFTSPHEMIAALADPMLSAVADQALAASGMTAAAFTVAWQQAEAGIGAPLAEPTLSAMRSQLAAGRAEYEEGAARLAESRILAEEQFAAAEQQLADAEQELIQGETDYTDGMNELEANEADAFAQFAEAEQELNDGEAEYADAIAELADAEAEAAAEFADAEQELNDAQAEIDDAWIELDKLEYATTYTLDRMTNLGYASLEGDASIVEGISRVFPVFFFLVAALVCITTMTRMVDDQRTQNGVLKALGYGNGAIIGQYFAYAGSASVLGCLVGFLLGSWGLPKIIWMAYRIMYTINRPNVLVLNWLLFFGCTALYLVCSLGATWLVCRRDLSEAAAELIRPKSPPAGKRILFERVKFIWKHVPFLHKVSIRNILRYKKRMFMMIVGVGGCTALLLTGFGVNDSIKNIVNYQYDEIEVFDASVTFTEVPDEETRAEFEEICAGQVSELAYVHVSSMDVVTENDLESVNVVAYDEPLDDFVNLKDENGPLAWPNAGEVVLNRRVAEVLNLSVGDAVTLRDTDYREFKLTVTGIFDNYVFDYAYVSAESCTDRWGDGLEFKSAYFTAADGADPYAVSAQILGMEDVASVSVNEDFRNRINNMLSTLDYIVLVIILCAGALAFIVLYNLINISITERIREIATLKVLGFYPGESAAYVYRENLILTGISALVGIPMGIAFLRFVISQVKVSLVYFQARLEPVSYVLAIVMTFVFAGIVCFFLYFKLERINMAESLKSIE